jgi:hypothetical protein
MARPFLRRDVAAFKFAYKRRAAVFPWSMAGSSPNEIKKCDPPEKRARVRIAEHEDECVTFKAFTGQK